MKQRTTALLTAGALALSLLGATVLAAEDTSAPDISSGQVEQLPSASSEEDPASSTEKLPPPEAPPAEEDGEDTQDTEPEEEEPEEPVEEYIPDPVGSISFGNLEHRMREGNLNMLALEENIQVIKSFDYDKMQEDLRQALNGIANAQWGLIIMQQGDSYAAAVLSQQYDATRKTFDDLKDGKLQADNADLVRQLENAQNQVVMAGEALYIALLDMERSGKTLERNLSTLDRSLKELELRYELGHISYQTLKQTQAGRTSLLSGQQTLNSNIDSYKMQLELLIGAELTGNIRLAALPQVTNEELAAMDLEADLQAAKEASYSLYEARQTVEDAEDDYKDAGRKYNYNEKRYEYVQAQHQWQAAQYTYHAAVQSFEMSLRTLYLQVKDYKQVLTAARNALAVEEDSYSVAQVKYKQGRLSQNALLEAEDKVKEARETVDGASIDLFTAYHNYRWAVDYGILN
ncbi:MAG: TolC family protein [Lawsonibacter sp.]|nr:TolC family protein [Lawsonibacter sp.]